MAYSNGRYSHVEMRNLSYADEASHITLIVCHIVGPAKTAQAKKVQDNASGS